LSAISTNADTHRSARSCSRPKTGDWAHFGLSRRAYIGYYDNMHNLCLMRSFPQRAADRRNLPRWANSMPQRQGAGYWDHIKNYLLLGDPALALAIAENTIELTLSKEVLLAGDTLSVSGRTRVWRADRLSSRSTMKMKRNCCARACRAERRI
jgi:hypothetical protein